MKKEAPENLLKELFNHSDLVVDSELKDRALSASTEGITISDFSLPDNPLIYINPGFEQVTGYKASEVIGLNCRFLQGRDTNQEAANQIRKAIRDQQSCIVELLNYRKDGGTFWNRLSITPIRDKKGKTTHFVGIQSDITRRKNAEDALLKAKQELESTNQDMKLALETAAQIQQSLLPQEAIKTSQIHIESVFYPCQELAGDILNFFYLDETHIACYILDVVGHGVPAALLSVTLSHFLSPYSGNTSLFGNKTTLIGQQVLSPDEVLENLNQRFSQYAGEGRFFTLLYGIYNLETNVFEYASAGHPPMIYQSENDGSTKILSTPGYPIGIVTEPDYRSRQIQLKKADRLFLYSDGLVEIENQSGILLTENGLCRFIEQGKTQPLKQAIDRVVEQIKIYSGRDSFLDDISFLAIECG